jgi:hypothetical protein
MESPTPNKPVMDIAPPKPQATAGPSPAVQSTAKLAQAVAAHDQLADSQKLAVHAAPAEDSAEGTTATHEVLDEKLETTASKKDAAKSTAKASNAKVPHPIRQIVVLTVLVMIILCGLAVLVYINA